MSSGVASLLGSKQNLGNFTGSTMNVPDGFAIVSAGSIDLTAGGTNENITLTPSGTGDLLLVKNSGGASTPWFDGALLTGMDATNSGWLTDVYGAQSRLDGRRANGTKAIPTTLVNSDAILTIGARGYNGAAYSGTTASIQFNATETWTNTAGTSTATGTKIDMFVVPTGTASAVTALTFGSGRIASIGASSSWAAWGTGGVALNSAAATYTDSSSSGTVATAVANSFASPTLAASAATTFTDSATLYISGAPAAGTNVTLTNPYSLWIDSGELRYDGTVSAAVATASTNKIRINANGTTYYLLVTTVP